MKCRHARKLIFDHIDGMISDRDRVGLERHLSECRSCEAMAAGLIKSLDLLRRLPPAEPGENFNWKLRLRLAKERNASRADVGSWLRWWNTRFALSALSTFVIVVVTGVVLVRSGIGPETGLLASKSEIRYDQMPEPANPVPVSPSPKMEYPKRTRGYTPGPFISSVNFDVPRPVGPIPVFFIRGRSDDVPTVAGGRGVLNVDSLRAQLLRSRRDAYRIQQLEQQVELLQTELQKCDVDKK